MRRLSALVIFLLIAVAPCTGQRADVSVHAAGPLPVDTRPFGKYLEEVCTLVTHGAPGHEERTVKCKRVPLEMGIHSKDQAITVKVVSDPSAKSPSPLQNPKVGGDFFVSATASSGLPVRQMVLMGNVSPMGGTRSVMKYHVNADGPILLRAVADGAPPLYSASAPVDLMLQPSAADSGGDSAGCAVLPTTSVPGTISMLLDAPTMVGLLGNPTPFILTAEGPNAIAVYATRQHLHPDEKDILANIETMMNQLASRTPDSLGLSASQGATFSVVLRIPHAAALGDLATRLGTLNASPFTVQDVGKGSVRVSAPSQPDCDTWKGFLTQIRTMVWQVVSEPMNRRLFYLSSSDVATAFTGLGGTPAASTPSSSSATTAAAAGGSAAAAAPSSPSSTATITIAQPPGSNIQVNSDTTPCVVAGLASGNATGCGANTTTAASSAPAAAPATSNTPAAPTALGMASVAVAAGTGEQSPPDLLVYSDANPGDDAQIEERNRILAQLDLPRPEMILNAWVAQDSSASQETIGAFGNIISETVANYDMQFEKVMWKGWQSLKSQSASNPAFYNEPFRSYLADRFVADTAVDASQTGKNATDMSQSFLDHSQAKLADPVAPITRKDYGLCERERYCLGYTDLFNPMKPALTDMLMLIVSAQNPIGAATEAVGAVEGGAADVPANNACAAATTLENRRRCEAIWKNLGEMLPKSTFEPLSCTERDLRGILGSLLAGEPTVHLRCFLGEAQRVLVSENAPGEVAPHGVGLMRAAMADFLYNYKVSQQYPHEFSAYDLSHSADALNTALSGIIDAFNRDLRTYQLFVRADMQYKVESVNRQTDGRCCAKRLFGLDKPSFFNDGLITVRTISGQQSVVSTTSQSALNVSTAPQLSTILGSLAGLGASSDSGGSGSPVSPLSKLSPIASLLSNYQTTYAQVGRQLNFTATPRSLAAASSAEIAVTLNADDSAPPTFMTGGAANTGLNFSRVATYETSTRVRVESIKLFEISSLTAIVETSRSRFPLLPPFVEIPYIGTFAGIPIGPAKEFHRSSAIISAYVIPTAADIAYGLRFLPDLITDGVSSGPCSFSAGSAGPDVTQPCVFNRMLSLRDVGPVSISQFNKNLELCFATDTSTNGCNRVRFDATLNSH